MPISRAHHSITLTFDNLGEASELERGTWRGPVGAHPSVTVVLPALLDELRRLGLPATFFVEGLNCELYPDALRAIVANGHELGAHGWRHEPWTELSPAREAELLGRATEAYATLGLEVEAFRPPGGVLTPRTASLLAEHGYRWCSPAGEHQHRTEGIDVIPFDWSLVDAYHLMDQFGPLRVSRGDQAPPRDPAGLADVLVDLLGAGGRPPVLVLHPFLMLEPAWWDGVRRLLGLISEL